MINIFSCEPVFYFLRIYYGLKKYHILIQNIKNVSMHCEVSINNRVSYGSFLYNSDIIYSVSHAIVLLKKGMHKFVIKLWFWIISDSEALTLFIFCM